MNTCKYEQVLIHTHALRWLLVLLWIKAFIGATELVETWLPLNFSIFSPQ